MASKDAHILLQRPVDMAPYREAQGVCMCMCNVGIDLRNLCMSVSADPRTGLKGGEDPGLPR